jgi:hypothetical protein
MHGNVEVAEVEMHQGHLHDGRVADPQLGQDSRRSILVGQISTVFYLNGTPGFYLSQLQMPSQIANSL